MIQYIVHKPNMILIGILEKDVQKNYGETP
jgi:hypothetical protein